MAFALPPEYYVKLQLIALVSGNATNNRLFAA